MSRFSTLVGLISTELDAIIGSAIPMTVGKLELEKLKSPPQIGWVVVEGRAGPAHGPGGNPKPIASRLLVAKAYVWHSTYDDTESLLHDLVLACHNTAGNTPHGVMFVREEWPTQDQAADYSVRGQLVIATFQVALPITTRALTEKQITEVGHTTGFDGSAESGCSS